MENSIEERRARCAANQRAYRARKRLRMAAVRAQQQKRNEEQNKQEQLLQQEQLPQQEPLLQIDNPQQNVEERRRRLTAYQRAWRARNHIRMAAMRAQQQEQQQLIEEEQKHKHNPHYYGNQFKHKMTKDRQYDLLKSSMAKFLHENKNCFDVGGPNGTVKCKQNQLYWTQLTEKLNKLGPPYRTMQEWKKVWCDFKRSEQRRKAKSKLKAEPRENEVVYDDDEIFQTEIDDTTASNDLKMKIKCEGGDNEQNSQSIYSNNYDNDYSYPDEDSLQVPYADEDLTVIPDESTGGSNAYMPRSLNDRPIAEVVSHLANNNNYYSSPPPLQPANAPMLNQTLYTLQNQMEHQTKLLEHLSQMSSTMAGLMERQADAVEKQTEAMRRQALATERHTSVMNKFINVIREKMFKTNSQKATSPTDISSDDVP